jgi:hypothetical protein
MDATEDGDEIRVAVGRYTGTMTTPGDVVVTATIVVTKSILAWISHLNNRIESQ